MCLNYFACSFALLKGPFTPYFCACNVFERTVVTLLRDVAVVLAACGAVSILGVALDGEIRCSAVCICSWLRQVSTYRVVLSVVVGIFCH